MLQHITDNHVLPTLFQQFGLRPFLFQLDIKNRFSRFGVAKHSPDLGLAPSSPTPAPDLTNAPLAVWEQIPAARFL